MKAWMHVLAAAVLLAGLGAASVRAHEEGKETTGKSHEWMTRVWKEKFGLSDDQIAKVKTAMKAKREAELPLRKEMRDGVEKLRAQLTLKQSESEIKATLDQVRKTRKALADEREKFQANMDAILTVPQRARMLVAFEARHQEMMESHARPWMRERMERMHHEHEAHSKSTHETSPAANDKEESEE